MIGLISALDLLQQIFFILGYFQSASSFEEKLSLAEQEQCIRNLAQNNDEHSREKLITHNLRLVAHITKKYSTCPIPQEDLLSIGTIGLIKGVNTYDMNKGSKFSSYISKCIDNEILMAIRTESKSQNKVFFEDVIGSDEEGNNILLSDVIGTGEQDITYQVDLYNDTLRLNSLIESALSSREAIIIKMRYGLSQKKKYSQIEVAGLLGISRSYVSRIEKKAVEKLAKEFPKIC